jgi:hypothetical protein
MKWKMDTFPPKRLVCSWICPLKNSLRDETPDPAFANRLFRFATRIKMKKLGNHHPYSAAVRATNDLDLASASVLPGLFYQKIYSFLSRIGTVFSRGKLPRVQMQTYPALPRRTFF